MNGMLERSGRINGSRVGRCRVQTDADPVRSSLKNKRVFNEQSSPSGET